MNTIKIIITVTKYEQQGAKSPLKNHSPISHYEKNKGYAPAYPCELVVHCFELLSQFASFDISFRFKGGNSILLILPEPERFSIDIDIDTSESKETLIKIMEEIEKRCEIFTKLEIRQHKTKPWLPMISFNMYYNSVYQEKEKSFVMLDAVLKKSPYEGYKKKIEFGSLYNSDISVEISYAEGLIGDKLLTLGPETLGIPIGKNKEAQRLKHVFDISRLYKKGSDIRKINESLLNCLAQENSIQNKNISIGEIREDTIKFAASVEKYDKIPDFLQFDEKSYIYEIVKGYHGFKEFLFKTEYTWQMFKADMNIVKYIIKKL